MASTKTFSAKVEVGPKIVMTFEGSNLEEFEEDIREGCLFAERCKFNPTAMMREEPAMVSMSNLCKALRAAVGDTGCHTFLTPKCDTYRKLFDDEKGEFRPTAHIITDSEESAKAAKPKPEAKPSKSEEGTVHLSPDMTTDELKKAIGKGGMKTIDLDDVDSLKKLLAAAKAEIKEQSNK